MRALLAAWRKPDSTSADAFALRSHTVANPAPLLDRIEADAARIAGLKGALSGLLNHYVALVNCGDCGNWDPGIEAPVIAARAALGEKK